MIISVSGISNITISEIADAGVALKKNIPNGTLADIETDLNKYFREGRNAPGNDAPVEKSGV